MNLPDRPLAALPRWGAAALLIATILACVWNVFALEAHNSAHEADIEHRLALGERVDMLGSRRARIITKRRLKNTVSSACRPALSLR